MLIAEGIHLADAAELMAETGAVRAGLDGAGKNRNGKLVGWSAMAFDESEIAAWSVALAGGHEVSSEIIDVGVGNGKRIQTTNFNSLSKLKSSKSNLKSTMSLLRKDLATNGKASCSTATSGWQSKGPGTNLKGGKTSKLGLSGKKGVNKLSGKGQKAQGPN